MDDDAWIALSYYCVKKRGASSGAFPSLLLLLLGTERESVNEIAVENSVDYYKFASVCGISNFLFNKHN